MKLLRYLALIFIDGFGITHPSMDARDRAASYIALLIVGVLVTVCLAFVFGLHLLRA
jgi:hypothetical protein